MQALALQAVAIVGCRAKSVRQAWQARQGSEPALVAFGRGARKLHDSCYHSIVTREG